ncbi:hypothetical protein C1Y63_11565 [Corynebacterium sp. 13CS0277]|uniref:rhomboid family intramembrane serine protease n=1 Tax=Corynebacterium sp. 13CS0277 TaxID=2071994 RepID=UPI000D028077|nr:rhomboid family intramembrane serine protease [Corynebacterium sp. 13CS0277]PRQ10433.1 hypothetical protein C1Y63_11565 [Corynebacterium sp. 13CS0277]
METTSRGRLMVPSILFAVVITVLALALGASVKAWLDEASKTDNGGLAFGVCFTVIGLSVAIAGLYAAVLERQGWSNEKYFRFIRRALWFDAAVAVACTVWFGWYPGYVNPTSLMGVLVALVTAWWVSRMCTVVAPGLRRTPTRAAAADLAAAPGISAAAQA